MYSEKIRKVKRLKEILIFILVSWISTVLSTIWLVGLAIIFRLFIEACKFVFNLSLRKREVE